jgi:glycosyltransferase involved in cell wall biosynthesis
MLFSVIIPTHNRPAYLAEAVASVLAQSIADFELLVINDGDALATLPNDPRIRILDNHQRGAVAARNDGVAQARGHFIAFLDDDDRWIAEDHLALALAELQNGAAFTFADGVMTFPGESIPRHFNLDANATSLEQDNTILISAVCYARQLHEVLGNFDEALPYYWDWDWYLRVARAGHKIFHIEKPMVDIRIHPQNMSGSSNERARRAGLDAFSAKHHLGLLSLKNHTDFIL